jgi:predicted  nucleic acid-binding Zn-ribbon protein
MDMVFTANQHTDLMLELETARERISVLTTDKADADHRIEELAGQVTEYVTLASDLRADLDTVRADLTHTE